MKKICVILLTLSFAALNARSQSSIDTSYSFGVRIIGSGKPMILIPGYKGSADTYNETVDHYKDHYKCYVITLAGFAGQPPSDAHDHLLLKQRDDIIRYIVNNRMHKPVLVGFSFGGTLALWIACTRPDLIGPFIALDATPFDAAVEADHLDKDSLTRADGARYVRALAQTPDYWRMRDSIYHTPENNRKGFIEVQKLVSDSTRILETEKWDEASDFRSGVLMELEADTLDLREDVAKIKSPILLLGSWKGWDHIETKAEAEKRYRIQYVNAKNLTMAFSEKGKHFLMWEDFNWMIREMDEFLRKD